MTNTQARMHTHVHACKHTHFVVFFVQLFNVTKLCFSQQSSKCLSLTSNVVLFNERRLIYLDLNKTSYKGKQIILYYKLKKRVKDISRI